MPKQNLPFGVQLRPDLYAGEKTYFAANPQVAGMAAEDGKVILNPYSKLSPEEMSAVARNEAARVHMQRYGAKPTFALTPEQQAVYKGSAYATNYPAAQQTTAARVFTGDPSIPTPTAEQKQWVQQNLSSRANVPFQYKQGGQVGPNGVRIPPTESIMQPSRPLIEPRMPAPPPTTPDMVPPALAALLRASNLQPPMAPPNPGIAGALGQQAIMNRPLPSFQEGGMVGQGGMPMIQGLPRGQGLVPPGGQPLSPQQIQMEAQRFVQQNPEPVMEIREAVNDALREGDMTQQQLQMLTQMAQVVLQQPNLYPQLRSVLMQQGLFDEEDLPQQFDQGVLFAILVVAQVAQSGGVGPGMPEQATPMSMRGEQAEGITAPPMGGMPTVPQVQQPMAGAPSMARGGPLPVKSPNPDGTVPINAHEGEYVIPADVVRRKGTEFFDKLLEGSKKSGDR